MLNVLNITNVGVVDDLSEFKFDFEFDNGSTLPVNTYFMGRKTYVIAKGSTAKNISNNTYYRYEGVSEGWVKILSNNTAELTSTEFNNNGNYKIANNDVTGYKDININVSGGGSTTASAKDINFYDYDGTIVASYTKDEFTSLSALPENPSHDGLTAQGWNWSLSDAKAYAFEYGKLNVGQMYITNDGKTRIYINLSEGRISPVLMLYLNDNSELDIDWGDSDTHSTWTTANASYKSERHNYPNKGEYVIVITVVSGSFVFQSQGASSYNTFFTDDKNGASSSDRAYLNSIQKIEIGDGVTTIETYAFYYCHALTSITIPNSVTSIGSSAFNNCYSLSSINIPNSVISIESQAFQNCYSLSSINIPNSVTSIGGHAFSYCTSLSSITIPDSITSIGTYAFSFCHSLSSITIPDSVTTIENYTFYYCYSLSSITILNSVTSIGTYAFSYCYSLYSITIPNGITSIGSQAFQNCYSLSSITIPNGITSIEIYVFQNCYSLSSINIPNGVTSIGYNAFFNCYSLSSITIPDSVTSIGSSAFQSCNSMDYIRFTRLTPPSVQSSNTWTSVSKSTIIFVPALVSNLYMNGTNYPSKSTYTYIGYATYESGTTLPTITTSGNYNLTWYATVDDAKNQTNPITQGNGNEVYSIATAV